MTDGYFEKDLVKEGVYAGERRVSITTVSKRLAEQLVEVIQKLGYGVSIYTVPEREIQFKDKKAISKCREAYTIRVRYSKSNYFSAKRGDGQRHKLEVLFGPGNSYNGDSEENSKYQMGNYNPKPGHNQPDQIHDGRQAARCPIF